MVKNEAKHLIEWPTTAQDMNVDLMLRVIGAEAQHLLLEKMAAMDAGGKAVGDLYMARTLTIIASVGLMHAIRTLRDVDPAKAEQFVREHWAMCDDGGAFGEWLWEWTREAGLDPSLIALSVPAEEPHP